jgi:SAM-dependent methyltransferase
MSNFFGLDAYRLFLNMKGLPKYYRDYRIIKKQKQNSSSFKFGSAFPVLHDWADEAGVASGHYYHQDLFVAQKICKANPHRHIDIGSRVDGFVAHVAAFRPIEIIDFRDLKSKSQNISFTQADLMNLPDHLIDSCDSISSLHAIEHFGLGRYGDPIDYLGHEKALSNIQRIVKKGGCFYFSVPIGEQRIEFNAHRVFSVRYLLEILQKDFTVKSFSFVDDAGDFYPEQQLDDQSINKNYGCHYGCGIFELIRK